MESVTFLLIILAVFTALGIAVFHYIFRNKERNQLNYWLSFLRFLSLFALLLLIINPSIKKKNIEIIKPHLSVAIDNSTSIKYNSGEAAIKNLMDLFKKNEDINDKFEIDYYGFGEQLYTLDSLKFDKAQTNLEAPFNEFSRLYSDGNNPVLLVSDGNQTVGKNIAFVNHKNPVYAFVVGDTAMVEDIAISRLNVNKFTFLNNRLPVEIFVNYNGDQTIRKTLSVFHKGKKVYSQRLDFSRKNNVQVVSFYLTATSGGTQYYTARIESLENEQNTINNVKNFSINVVEEPSEILVLSSVVHPDLGMLKKSVESDKQRSVTLSNIRKYKGNISDYQLIILYQPTKNFDRVWKEIMDKKAHFFIITGVNTDWDFLNSSQDYFSRNTIDQSEEYHPVFNTNYATFITKNIGFSNFAPLEGYFGEITFKIPYQPLLFQKIGTFETEKPLLATFEIDQQKGGVLFGEHIWRWRMNNYTENRSFQLFDGFMSNLIQYLSSNQKNKRLQVAVNPIYFANETITFSASYLDENLNFDHRAKLWLTVSNKKTSFLKKFPFATLNGRFQLELSDIPAEEYNYTVTVDGLSDQVSGSFKILPFEVEQQFTNSNDGELKIITSGSNGQIFYEGQEEMLLNNLNSDVRFKSIQQLKTEKTPLINWKWILGFIILTLSIEWFTRKYFGKI